MPRSWIRTVSSVHEGPTAGRRRDATLSATLTASGTGQGRAGQTVSFTLDNASVGTAVTNSSGVATLTGVPTTDAVGTDSSGVVASFAGDSNHASTTASGNL